MRENHGPVALRRLRPRSGPLRVLAIIGSAVLALLAMYWFNVGRTGGWQDGSFALIGYGLALCFAAGSLACLRWASGL
jgi:hypothetical protein